MTSADNRECNKVTEATAALNDARARFAVAKQQYEATRENEPKRTREVTDSMVAALRGSRGTASLYDTLTEMYDAETKDIYAWWMSDPERRAIKDEYRKSRTHVGIATRALNNARVAAARTERDDVGRSPAPAPAPAPPERTERVFGDVDLPPAHSFLYGSPVSTPVERKRNLIRSIDAVNQNAASFSRNVASLRDQATAAAVATRGGGTLTEVDAALRQSTDIFNQNIANFDSQVANLDNQVSNFERQVASFDHQVASLRDQATAAAATTREGGTLTVLEAALRQGFDGYNQNVAEYNRHVASLRDNETAATREGGGARTATDMEAALRHSTDIFAQDIAGFNRHVASLRDVETAAAGGTRTRSPLRSETTSTRTRSSHPKIRVIDRKAKEGEEACHLCEDNVVCAATVPCNHRFFCVACVDKLVNEKCPMCRCTIEEWTVQI